jgi:hypothetical protein
MSHLVVRVPGKNMVMGGATVFSRGTVILYIIIIVISVVTHDTFFAIAYVVPA